MSVVVLVWYYYITIRVHLYYRTIRVHMYSAMWEIISVYLCGVDPKIVSIYHFSHWYIFGGPWHNYHPFDFDW